MDLPNQFHFIFNIRKNRRIYNVLNSATHHNDINSNIYNPSNGIVMANPNIGIANSQNRLSNAINIAVYVKNDIASILCIIGNDISKTATPIRSMPDNLYVSFPRKNPPAIINKNENNHHLASVS